jgi:hypothetical protein
MTGITRHIVVILNYTIPASRVAERGVDAAGV